MNTPPDGTDGATTVTDVDPGTEQHDLADPPTNPYLHVPPAMSRPFGGPSFPPTSRDGLGTAALVLGIVGLVLSPSVVLGLVLGALAVILGLVARGRVRRGEAFNPRATTVGIVLGAIAVVVAVIAGVVVATNLPRLTAAVGGTPANNSLQQCVRQANGDRAAVRQCRQQFGGAARGAKHRPGGTQAPPGAQVAPSAQAPQGG